MDTDFRKLLKRVEQLKKNASYDLSMEEDLSLAIMNLISLEEHFFFTAEKTNKPGYLDLLKQTREIRKDLMGRLIDKHEGETWCVTKHLLAATMRLIEVATKLQTSGNITEAKRTFDESYKTYSLFWAVRLKLIDLKNVRQKVNTSNSLEAIVAKLVDCCQE